MTDEKPVQSKFGPDREMWRETPNDAYSPSIHVTGNGLIGINVGGIVIVRSVREIHQALSRDIEWSNKKGGAE